MMLDRMISNELVNPTIHLYRAVFKFNPVKRVISFLVNPHDYTLGDVDYFLSFPVIYFSLVYRIHNNKFHFCYLRIAFGGGKGKTKKPREIYFANLPNVFSDLHICLGRLDQSEFNSLEDLAQAMVEQFWAAQFNAYFINRHKRDDVFHSLKSWAEKTRNNPKWIPSSKDMKKITQKTYRASFNLK